MPDESTEPDEHTAGDVPLASTLGPTDDPADDQEARRLPWWVVGVVAAVLVALVGGGIAWQLSRDGESSGDAAGAVGELAGTVTDTGVSFGSGPRVVTTFVDYQCEHCAEVEDTIGGELETMLDAEEITLLVRPVWFISRSSMRGSAALHCAAPEGHGLAMHAAMLEDLDGDFSRAGLTALAGSLGMDEDAFSTCLADEATSTWVSDVSQAASDLGLTSVPVVLVDDDQVLPSDLQTAEAFRAVVLGEQ